MIRSVQLCLVDAKSTSAKWQKGMLHLATALRVMEMERNSLLWYAFYPSNYCSNESQKQSYLMEKFS